MKCAERADSGHISCVGNSDIDASRHLVCYLVGSGRQRIALINHDLSYKYAKLRQQGYQRELDEQHLHRQSIVYASKLSFQAGKQAMSALLQGKDTPDAVFAVTDSLAAGAMSAIKQTSLRVPQDITVAGFDGTGLAEMVSPLLATIAQPSRQIGKTAFDLLLAKVDNPESPVEQVMMDWHLVERAST